MEEQSTFQFIGGQGIVSLFYILVLEGPMAELILEEDPPLEVDIL